MDIEEKYEEELKSFQYKIIRGVVICKESGEFLLDLILDTKINPIMLSSFLGALSLFGKENLGKIEEIDIKGLDVDLIIVNKYNLILVTIIDKQAKSKTIREEAELTLDMFYMMYQTEIENQKIVDVNTFNEFKDVLLTQIKEYLENLKKNETPDFGFFTQAIKKMKEE